MADRRMFTKSIIDSDAFLDMPLTTQALYFHLSMRADDDGFLNNANKVMRMIGANKNDFDVLECNRFVITFPDGICVIKHWRMHNYIRKDRYIETKYKEEKDMLSIKKNGAYTLESADLLGEEQFVCNSLATDGQPPGNQVATNWQPTGNHLATQVRLGKDSIDNINTLCAEQPVAPHEADIKKSDIESFFESVWGLYPNKKGKGQVSMAKKKKLHQIGTDELTRAINRYKQELEKEKDWRKPQNGSTFFNSGYVDYLDANYVASSAQNPPQPTNKFHNFEQRAYDFGDLEQRLLNKANGITGGTDASKNN